MFQSWNLISHILTSFRKSFRIKFYEMNIETNSAIVQLSSLGDAHTLKTQKKLRIEIRIGAQRAMAYQMVVDNDPWLGSRKAGGLVQDGAVGDTLLGGRSFIQGHLSLSLSFTFRVLLPPF